METKRKCKRDGCITPLAESNRGPYCYAHTEGMAIVEHTPVTCFTSYKPDAYASITERVLTSLPGDLNYNDMAFVKTVVGHVGQQEEEGEED